METKSAPLEGVLHFYSETGTEGGYWAFQDKRFIEENPNGDDIWFFPGLHLLHDGDHLTIYDEDNPNQVIWSGLMEFNEYPVFTEDAYGMWIHADQEGVPLEVWAEWFLREYPARLVLGEYSLELLKKIPRSH